MESEVERLETASKEKGNEAPRVRAGSKSIALTSDKSRCLLRLKRQETRLERYARSLGMLCKMSGVKPEVNMCFLYDLGGRREPPRCLTLRRA